MNLAGLGGVYPGYSQTMDEITRRRYVQAQMLEQQWRWQQEQQQLRNQQDADHREFAMGQNGSTVGAGGTGADPALLGLPGTSASAPPPPPPAAPPPAAPAASPLQPAVAHVGGAAGVHVPPAAAPKAAAPAAAAPAAATASASGSPYPMTDDAAVRMIDDYWNRAVQQINTDPATRDANDQVKRILLTERMERVKAMSPLIQEALRNRALDLQLAHGDEMDRHHREDEWLRWQGILAAINKGNQQYGTLAPDKDPTQDRLALAIATYRQPTLTGYALVRPQGKKTMDNVLKINPQFDASVFPMRQKARRDFGTGPLGTNVVRFNVLTQHLDTLQKAVEALNNGDMKAFNFAANLWTTQTGKKLTTDVTTIKRLVGDEIVRAVTGNPGALGDRTQADASFALANSPEQLMGSIVDYKTLAAGQLQGLRQQYIRTVWDGQNGPDETLGGTDFDNNYLSPQTRESIETLAPSFTGGGGAAPAAPGQQGAAPQPGAAGKAPAGVPQEEWDNMTDQDRKLWDAH